MKRLLLLDIKKNEKKRGGGHLAWLDVIEKLEFESISAAAEYFGCTISNISLMLEKGTIGQRGKRGDINFLIRTVSVRFIILESVTTIETEKTPERVFF